MPRWHTHNSGLSALISATLRVVANNLPVGLGGPSRTERLRHLRVPFEESDRQRRGAIQAGFVDVHPWRSEQPAIPPLHAGTWMC